MAAPEPHLPLSGGCLCGRIRYEVRVQPRSLVVCHCHLCQRRSGSAFGVSMPVDRQGFAITEGVAITRVMPGGSGALSTHYYCDECLCRTHSEPSTFPAISFVRAGTLDDTSWLQPVAQLWMSSAQTWACVDGILSFEGNADDPETLRRAWRER